MKFELANKRNGRGNRTIRELKAKVWVGPKRIDFTKNIIRNTVEVEYWKGKINEKLKGD